MSRKKWGAASFFEKKGRARGEKKYGAADKKRGPGGKNVPGGREKKGGPKEGADPLPLKK